MATPYLKQVVDKWLVQVQGPGEAGRMGMSGSEFLHCLCLFTAGLFHPLRAWDVMVYLYKLLTVAA